MTKLNNPLLSLDAWGTLCRRLALRRHPSGVVIEAKPEPTDPKSSAQLAWRTMYQKAVALWHLLSPAEKSSWETAARPLHMTGFAWFMSQALKPNPGIYLPFTGGTMKGNIDMDSNRILRLPAPIADEEPLRKMDGGAGFNLAFKTFTRLLQAETGLVAYNGFGFQPKCLFIIANCAALVASTISFCNELIQTSLYQMGDGSGNLWKQNNVIDIVNNMAQGQVAVFYCWLADGFGLSWVKVGALTGTIQITVLALG